VIFSFLQFILVCCGGPRAVVASFNCPSSSCDGYGGRRLKHIFCLSFVVPPWSSARQMLRWCVLGTLLYVVVGILAASSAFAFALGGRQDESLEVTVQVLSSMLSFSQAVAIVALAELADNLMDDLRPLRPLPKFLSVKLVVFFTFWQSVVLKGLTRWGFFDQFLDEHHKWSSKEQLAEATQNFLICIEMCAASVAHAYVFPSDDYTIVMDVEQTPPQKLAFVQKRLAVVDFRDVIDTVHLGTLDDLENEDDECTESDDVSTSSECDRGS